MSTAEEQMSDPDEYRKVYNHWPERDPCVVEGCVLSQQEHHRLAFGWLKELSELRRFREEHAHLATPEAERE